MGHPLPFVAFYYGVFNDLHPHGGLCLIFGAIVGPPPILDHESRGVLIIVLGIQFTGLINLPFLQMEKRFELGKKPIGYLGSFIVGLIFAAGWTPCIGPILSAILIYASTSKNFTTGIFLLAVYSLGLGIPFLLASLAFNSFLTAFGRIRQYLRVMTMVSGFFLIAIGILFLTDTFKEINAFFNFLTNP